jgi:IclR family acetate operon transcriptional repressor
MDRTPTQDPTAQENLMNEVKQVSNVLDLLEFFAERQDSASLTEIYKRFEWPKSSAFKLLTTLVNRGYLYEPYARGGFYPSRKWLWIARQIETGEPIPLVLEETVNALAVATGETVVLAAVSGDKALFIMTAESKQAVRYAAPVGKSVPIHVTATGRALLSQLSAAERDSVLRRVKYERFTSKTLTSRALVEAEIVKGVKRGWFEGSGEFTSDLGGVALPFQFEDRRLAVMIAGPMDRVRSRYTEFARLARSRLKAMDGVVL